MSTITTAGGNIVYIQDSGGAIQYQINSTSGSWTTISAPYTIVNSSPGVDVVQVIFTTDITITSATQYFVCGSANIQFGSATLNENGSRPVIDVSNVTNYSGFILNGGSGFDGYNDISVYNLVVNASGTTTQGADGGWLGRVYFGRGATNNVFVNCSSNGSIRGGGIVGGFCARLGVLSQLRV